MHRISNFLRHTDRKTILVFFVYGCSLISLFFYSFTQVDLNLTLSRINLWFGFQDFFQHIGYYQRPLSMYWYILTMGILTACYIIFQKKARRGMLTIKTTWFLVILTAITLYFAYPAFSYDLFNYLFDARIVTVHGENPYVHKALDYPSDPWINFMRWTHRTYPYGPVWLGLTIPLSFAGLGYFLPTLLLFKLLAHISFFGTVWFIQKILTYLWDEKKAIVGMILFGLNPLVIVESLISSHNDIVMMFFAMMSLYILIRKKRVSSFLSLLASIGIKFATGFLLPVWVIGAFGGIKKERWQLLFRLSFALMLLGVIVASIRTQFQPWYLLFVIPYAALMTESLSVIPATIVLSVGSLFLYTPFIYFGNWDPPVPGILASIELICVVVALVVATSIPFLPKKGKISYTG